MRDVLHPASFAFAYTESRLSTDAELVSPIISRYGLANDSVVFLYSVATPQRRLLLEPVHVPLSGTCVSLALVGAGSVSHCPNSHCIEKPTDGFQAGTPAPMVPATHS